MPICHEAQHENDDHSRKRRPADAGVTGDCRAAACTGSRRHGRCLHSRPRLNHHALGRRGRIRFYAALGRDRRLRGRLLFSTPGDPIYPRHADVGDGRHSPAYGSKWAITLYVALLLGAVAFQAGNFTGAALALNFLLPSIPILVWVGLLALAALLMCWVGVYRLLENINRVIIGLIVLSFVLTLALAGPDPGEVAATGFSFQIPEGNYWLILALIATTLPPNTVLGLSAFIKRKYEGDTTTPMDRRLALSRFDHTTNVVITGVVMVAILLCSAAALHPLGTGVSGAADMAGQLTPVLGQYAGVLFSLGLWAAGFSSGLFNIAVQPPLLGEATGRNESARSSRNRGVMLLAALAPVVIVALYGSTPIELILTAQAINGLLLPAIVGSIWVLCNQKTLLGALSNTFRQNLVYGAVMLIVCLLALRVFLGMLGVI